MINAKVLLATRPPRMQDHGLITLQIECPLYVWTELLTHRRFSRNASSGRAMSVKRYTGMGNYVPRVFYKQGKGMRADMTRPIRYQWIAEQLYKSVYTYANTVATLLDKLGVSKEQKNRVIPQSKIVRGIVTGTEDAWRAFLELRNTEHADNAMQDLARDIKLAIGYAQWEYKHEHIPLKPSAEEVYAARDCGLPLEDIQTYIAMARLARVSYAREKGKDDLTLAVTLLREKHLSPMEHIAYWKENPFNCSYTCMVEDRLYTDTRVYGWEHARAAQEYDTQNAWHTGK